MMMTLSFLRSRRPQTNRRKRRPNGSSVSDDHPGGTTETSNHHSAYERDGGDAVIYQWPNRRWPTDELQPRPHSARAKVVVAVRLSVLRVLEHGLRKISQLFNARGKAMITGSHFDGRAGDDCSAITGKVHACEDEFYGCPWSLKLRNSRCHGMRDGRSTPRTHHARGDGKSNA